MRAIRFVSFLLPASFLLLSACSSSSPEGTVPETPPPASPDAGGGEDAGPGEPQLDPLAAAVDALFREGADRDEFAGSVILLDAGETILEKGYGLAERAGKRENTAATIFRIGSVSKQFVATAILALVADGKLAVTDPLSKFFPDYPKENLTKDGVEVTLHHLMSHTSGLPDPRKTKWFEDNIYRKPMDPKDQREAVSSLPLERKPGEAFVYTNYNFLLLGLVVEQVTGEPYETFFKKRFFEPLGMKDSGTVLPPAKAQAAALPYFKDGESVLSLSEDPSFKDPDYSYAFGSGQIYSTAGDMARWDRALTGEAVLPKAQRDLLFEPNLDHYCYGWIVQNYKGTDIQWHNGALPVGFSSFVVRIPAKDRFVAFLSNMNTEVTRPLESKLLAIVTR